MNGEEGRSDQVGVAMTDHLGKTHTIRIGVPYRLLHWLTVSPMVPFPDTYGAKQAALHQFQRPDRDKLEHIMHIICQKIRLYGNL